jgi:hypothetical protein
MPDQFAEQIKKLEALRHTGDSSALEEFDEETERLILQRFGETTKHMEAYELATMGEAESIVNMPQSAQEDATQDLFHKGIEQRRQVLEGCLADLAETAARPTTPQAATPPAPQPTPRAAPTTPRAAGKKKKPAAKKARPVKKAAKRAAKNSAKKRPAAERKQAKPAKKKRAKRK